MEVESRVLLEVALEKYTWRELFLVTMPPVLEKDQGYRCK